MTPAHVKSLLISGLYFPPQVGGISNYMASVASALGPDRVCCLTAVAANGGNDMDTFEPRVYRRPMVFTGSTALQAVTLGATITEIMVRERPRIVQLATVGEGSFGLWLRRWLRLPFVIYAHGNEILEAMHSGWEKPRLSLRQADRVFANSRFTKDLVRQIGVDPSKIDIVHPGCNIDQFRPQEPRPDLRRKLLGQRDEDRVILTVGNLVARKGHDMVIRALPRLRHTIPNVMYLIVGDGPYRAQLQTLAKEVGLGDRVIFAGRIPDDDLPDVYALCDVFVMPSREHLTMYDVEGFGIVFLEANACGKPVIGGRSGGIPDAIEDGSTGFLVDPHDPEDLVNALKRLLVDKELSIRFGQEGRARAVRDFSWGRIADRVQRSVDFIVAEKIAPTRRHF